jgi:hypothetical protein
MLGAGSSIAEWIFHQGTLRIPHRLKLNFPDTVAEEYGALDARYI